MLNINIVLLRVKQNAKWYARHTHCSNYCVSFNMANNNKKMIPVQTASNISINNRAYI